MDFRKSNNTNNDFIKKSLLGYCKYIQLNVDVYIHLFSLLNALQVLGTLIISLYSSLKFNLFQIRDGYKFIISVPKIKF